jgi:hypothetical protein
LPLLFLLLLSIVAIVALFAFLLRELFARNTVSTFDPMWLQEFSIAKYRPMARLLADEDYEFVANQSGFDEKISSNLRAERRRIFRAYLRSLVHDFNRLHFCAKLMATHSSEDRSDVLNTLVKQRVTFSLALAAVECRLILHSFGFGPVEVRKLISTLDQSRMLLVATPGRA